MLFDWINDLAGRVSLVDQLMKWSAQYVVYAVIALVIASWFVRAGNGADRRMAVYTAIIAAALSLAVALVIQRFYVHQRPFILRSGDIVQLLPHAADPSFPSEHATGSFALAAGIGLYRARFGIALLALAALISFSRVYVGIHYPADVAAGALIGIASAVAVWLARPLLAWFDATLIRRIVPAPLL